MGNHRHQRNHDPHRSRDASRRNVLLWTARIERGWSQEQVAEAIGTDHVTVSRWERCVTFPSPHFRQKLCALYGRTPAELGVVPLATARLDATAPGYDVPFEVPYLPLRSALEGRTGELQALKKRLCTHEEVSALGLFGIPGVGKTQLAVELACDAEVRRVYRDGVLWAGLGPRPDVLGLLSSWAAVVGLSAVDVSQLTTIEALGRAIRGAIGMRRFLLVIDDAWTIEEALAFVVGGPQCAHLATSRFPGLAHGVASVASQEPVAVCELCEDDALALLARLAPDVVAAEPHETRKLAQSVGGLPLALTLMGRSLRAQAYSGQPRRLRAALERLRSTEARLQVTLPHAPVDRPPSLPEGTPLSLYATIAVSDQQLSAAARAALRALALLPAKPNTFSEEAAVMVCAATVETIDELTDAGLLEGSGAGRYTLHQTIASYAGLSPADPAAMARFVQCFVAFVEAHQADVGTLDVEMGNVVAALRVAVASGLRIEQVRGTLASMPYWLAHGHYDSAKSFLLPARDAAQELGDWARLTASLLALGRVAERRGRYTEADSFVQEGLALAREQGNADPLSGLLHLAGILAAKRGDTVQAEACYVEGLALARQIGHWERVCALLTTLGSQHAMQGDSSRADTCYQEGLRIAQEMDLHERHCGILQGLGTLAGRRGQYLQAVAYFREGLVVARALGARERQCSLLANLAVAAMDQGDYEQAKIYLEEGLALARALGHPEQQCSLLAKLGDVMMRENRQEEAMTALLDGLALAQTLGHQERTAALLCMLARLARRQEMIEQAEIYVQDGLAVAQTLGHRPLIAGFLLERGALSVSRNRVEAAADVLGEALQLAEAVDSAQLRAEALYGLAHVAAAAGNLEEAVRQGNDSLRLMEEMRLSMRNEVATWLRGLPVVTTARHARQTPPG